MNLFSIRKLFFLVGCLCLLPLSAQKEKTEVMSKLQDKTYRIDTRSLGNSQKGFKGTTPLMVYIKNNKIVKIESLPNNETPAYYNDAAKQLFAQYVGKKVTQLNEKTPIDGVTGATYSSKAIQHNVNQAIKYYLNHK